MKLSLRVLGILLVCLMLSALVGCFPAVSVNPWYSDRDTVQDNNILGTWIGEGSDEPGIFTITKADGQGYKLTAPDKTSRDITESLSLHLFRLDGQLYLDAVEDHVYYKNEELGFGAFRLPAHMVGKVTIDKDALSIQFLDDTWLSNSVKSGTASLAHIDTREDIVVTAATPELQTVINKYRVDQKAFAIEMKLHRKTQ